MTVAVEMKGREEEEEEGTRKCGLADTEKMVLLFVGKDDDIVAISR